MGLLEASRDAVGKIEITPVSIKVVQLTVVGLEPLVMHQFGEKARKIMLDAQMGKKAKKREAKSPVDCYQDSRYLDDQGRDCIPAAAFKRAGVSAARYCRGAKMTELKGAFFVKGNLIPIEYSGDEPIMREDVVRLQSGVCDIRHRPEYPAGWSAQLRIEYIADQISLESLVNLLAVAGRCVGIGEMRPEKAGLQFGTFEVDGTTITELRG
jgi:hypothetical protein